VKRVPLLATICLLSTHGTAPAPIYGSFPGLDQLIKGAEFIVVADVEKGPSMEEVDIGGGGVFEICVDKVLKGAPKEGKATAYLRDLGLAYEPTKSASLGNGLVGGRCLLFLNKPGTHVHVNEQPPPANFEDENCEGDAVWITSSGLLPPTNYFNFDSLRGKSVREAVVALLNHAAIEHQKSAAAVQSMIESHSDRNALTQLITDAVSVVNPEDAAKFYLSVFKNARKDPNINQYNDVFADQTPLNGVRLWIDGQTLTLLTCGPDRKPIESPGLTVNCDLQEDIDYYWDKLSAGGEKSHAGWVKDKFGVRWHIIPSDLPHLLGGKYGDAKRVLEALSKMEKIDAAALSRAAHPELAEPRK
jgi:predicted 3-demethylubiquinone-9 3-methyltransferase (glyoxalase superfamily)